MENKKPRKVSIISLTCIFFATFLMLVGCSKPKWVDLGSDAAGTSKTSVDVESITKIQLEKSIRINAYTQIKREMYSVWIKVSPEYPPEPPPGPLSVADIDYFEKKSQIEKDWINRDGKKISFKMQRFTYDLANREYKIDENIIYYETGGYERYAQKGSFAGVTPDTMSELILDVIQKYHP